MEKKAAVKVVVNWLLKECGGVYFYLNVNQDLSGEWEVVQW